MKEVKNEEQKVETKKDQKIDAKKLNIYQKMALATSKIASVRKNLTVGKGTKSEYKATKEKDVLNAIKPIENEVGIYSYPVDREILRDERVTFKNQYGETENFVIRIKTIYRFVNLDDKDDYIDIISYGDGIDSQDKSPGKAMTYSDKYALLKAYKVETGDDENIDNKKQIKAVKKEPLLIEEKDPEKQKENLRLLAEFKTLVHKTNTDVEKIYEHFKVKNDTQFTERMLKGAIEILKQKPVVKEDSEVF